MHSSEASQAPWAASYRLVAAEKWRRESAAMGRAATETLVDYVAPQPGMRVLDLASGTGEPAISIAERVGSQGHVAALDLNAELLESAQQRARQRNLTNLSFHQADAQCLPFPDQHFDLATCRFGVMFFAEVEKALRELHRVLKPGGRACFLAWGPFEQPYWTTTIGTVLKHVGGPAIPPGGANPFRFADPGSLAKVLVNAGFAAVREETRELPWTWPGSVEDVWEYARSVSAPFRPLMERVPAERWEQINKEAHAAIGRYSDGKKVDFGAVLVLASGSKP